MLILWGVTGTCIILNINVVCLYAAESKDICLQSIAAAYMIVQVCSVIFSTLSCAIVYLTITKRVFRGRDMTTPTTNLFYIYLLPMCLNFVITLVSIRLGVWKQAVEILMLLNCLIDPMIYVFWFKECQVRVLEILAHVWPAANRRALKMHVEISKRNRHYKLGRNARILERYMATPSPLTRVDAKRPVSSNKEIVLDVLSLS